MILISTQMKMSPSVLLTTLVLLPFTVGKFRCTFPVTEMYESALIASAICISHQQIVGLDRQLFNTCTEESHICLPKVIYKVFSSLFFKNNETEEMEIYTSREN